MLLKTLVPQRDVNDQQLKPVKDLERLPYNMDLTDHHSVASNCSFSSIALFEGQFQQEDIIEGQWEKVNPTKSLEGSNVIAFIVRGNDSVIDLHNCYIQTKIKIKLPWSYPVSAS